MAPLKFELINKSKGKAAKADSDPTDTHLSGITLYGNSGSHDLLRLLAFLSTLSTLKEVHNLSPRQETCLRCPGTIPRLRL